jgi:hypothetical protein
VNLRLHPVYHERFARRARSLPAIVWAPACRAPLSPLSPSLISQCSAFDRRRALTRFFSAPGPLNFQPSTVNSLASPLFVAFPYISPASPLSSAFTHFNGGGRGRFSLSVFPISSFKFLFSHLSSATCRLLPLSLQRFHPSFSLFSTAYSLFFADQGGGVSSVRLNQQSLSGVE